ncbi:DNA/RNA nuclease SfsA [Clostridium thermarum]|uniref:DNA/RNA nuclease SfsA n=1 Tax=Clostridium thermarum TaxID=1716543 RepID=UPI00111E9B56|nr:DNA/RNA nuclease SfsA [Clostridium thermarum]
MLISKKVVKAKFIRRPNRFKAYVYLNDEEIVVHVPNTGRCREILTVGTTVLLREENNPLRKTPYDLIAGYKGDVLISIDSQVPNKVVEEALKLKKVDNFKDFDLVEREKTFGNSRFDFKLTDTHQNREYYLEVKGVTLERDGMAMFPDAPTERGAKHLRELVEVIKAGKGAGVLFVIQIEGIKQFRPNDEMDKHFGDALRYAHQNGVDVYAYNCTVTENSITLKNEVQVIL